MGPPGGGRNSVTPRLVRHFNLVYITEFDDESYIKIYSAIVNWWQQHSPVHEDVKAKTSAVVKATIQVYNTIRKELLPTPLKSHYTYNMRDLSKVFQVRLFAKPASISVVKSAGLQIRDKDSK